jgi:hypothetical protein
MSRETIHISLGSKANAVTAHLLNLQGLAATDSTCDPNITHAAWRETYVPRVLIVDEANQFSHSTVERNVTTWTGKVEEMNENAPEDADEDKADVKALQEAASTLAYSTHSRYHVTPDSSYAVSSDGRQVQWDSDEEEEEEEDEEEKQQRQERTQQKWFREKQQPLQEQMESFWNTEDSTTTHDSLSWMDYWMPPHPPNYAVVLPFSRQSNIVEHWDTYQNGTSMAEELLEKLRQVLEACNAAQGITVMTEGCGIYAGLTTTLLQNLQEECRTAGRFVMHVNDSRDDTTSVDKDNGKTEIGWQLAQAERVRQYLQTGLALHDMTTHAHVVLPLALDSSLFSSSARMALAIEIATLPYRLSGQRSKVGLSGGYYGGVGPSDEGYGVASHLSFGEYLACLQPSSQYPILELDVMMNESPFWNESLLRGTSLEQQRMMQHGGRDARVRRPRDALPGEWLNGASDGGLLSLQSPETGNLDRSLHHHFALTTSLRPTGARFSISQYLTLLMEGMAIRYRPQVSMGAVLGESVSSLTAGGYGAGSYWKFLLKNDVPVLSVVGNTTRSYGYLCEVASNFEQVLNKPRFRGHHARDVAHGILSDGEDCAEAVEHCLDLRDAYAPPEGSGLVVNTEGTYFDS